MPHFVSTDKSLPERAQFLIDMNPEILHREDRRFPQIKMGEDFIIVRSIGKPLYVLCNAVDDIRDGITHIIRGQDGLANTPKQILLYEALGSRELSRTFGLGHPRLPRALFKRGAH